MISKNRPRVLVTGTGVSEFFDVMTNREHQGRDIKKWVMEKSTDGGQYAVTLNPPKVAQESGQSPVSALFDFYSPEAPELAYLFVNGVRPGPQDVDVGAYQMFVFTYDKTDSEALTSLRTFYQALTRARGGQMSRYSNMLVGYVGLLDNDLFGNDRIELLNQFCEEVSADAGLDQFTKDDLAPQEVTSIHSKLYFKVTASLNNIVPTDAVPQPLFGNPHAIPQYEPTPTPTAAQPMPHSQPRLNLHPPPSPARTAAPSRRLAPAPAAPSIDGVTHVTVDLTPDMSSTRPQPRQPRATAIPAPRPQVTRRPDPVDRTPRGPVHMARVLSDRVTVRITIEEGGDGRGRVEVLECGECDNAFAVALGFLARHAMEPTEPRVKSLVRNIVRAQELHIAENARQQHNAVIEDRMRRIGPTRRMHSELRQDARATLFNVHFDNLGPQRKSTTMSVFDVPPDELERHIHAQTDKLIKMWGLKATERPAILHRFMRKLSEFQVEHGVNRGLHCSPRRETVSLSQFRGSR